MNTEDGESHEKRLRRVSAVTYIIMLVVFAAGVIVGMLLIALSAGASCDDAYHAGYRDGVRRAAETKAELFELATDGLDAGEES